MTQQTYQFDKGVAEHVVWAEARHFAANVGLHGYSEDEVQSLTRAMSFRVDKDLHWTEVDVVVEARMRLDHLTANSAGDALVDRFRDELRDSISNALGTVHSRWEVAA
jgi:hypothetical protein